MAVKIFTSHHIDELPAHVLAENYELLPATTKPQYASSTYSATAPRKSLELTPRLRNHWRVLLTMIGLFLLALLVALVHLSIFVYLNGKPADGQRSIPQNYVATVSHLLGLIFRTLLCGSLYIAFTQCLWHLMRVKTIEVLAIDRLFKITSNPLLLFNPGLLKTAPLLYILASFALLLPIAITFPQGALIVTSASASSTPDTVVPTYNGAYIGNGSSDAVYPNAFAVTTIASSALIYTGPLSIILRIGQLILEAGDISTSSSPCGPDCSYRIQFEGPYVQCNTTVVNQDAPESDGGCDYVAFAVDAPAGYVSNFSISMVSPVIRAHQGQPNNTVNVTSITCTPSRATYLTTFTYRNGSRSVSYNANYIGRLADMIIEPDWMAPPPCYTGDQDCASPFNWTQSQIDTIAGYNHYTIIQAFVNAMQGSYNMTSGGLFVYDDDPPVLCLPETTIVGYTRFNTQRDSLARVAAPKFVVTEDLINDALFNMTLSAALQLGFYNDTVTASTTTTYNIYSFTEPQQLLIPYLLCLLLSLPFLFLGTRSLRQNGVSAMDGGFLQVLMTTTGSERLSKAAAGGCLGGEENIPADLKKMKIRFGEILGSTTHDGLTMASFGVEDEVVTLRSGVAYGV